MIELYGHSGSVNHGCEAIVRGTAKVLGNIDVLWTSNIESDQKYGLNEIVNLKKQVKIINKNSILRYYLAIKMRLLNNQWHYYKEMYKPLLNNLSTDSIYLSIGGDHYCYGPVSNQIYGKLNSEIRKQNNQTILWGCSIEPKDLNESTIEDLASYKYVVTRESLSYDALKNKGLKNIKLIPDVAFQLDSILLELPENFKEGDTVGINLSPLVGKYSNKDLIMENYKKVITYILDETTAPAVSRLGTKVFGISENLDVMDGAKKTIEAVEDFCFNTLGLKSGLSDLGIDEKHFKEMAEHACAGGIISGPRNLTSADVEKIYEMCLR